MTIQEFLKEKIKEAGITQATVAERIGWSRQNLNFKLQHTGGRFSSMLRIAEGIGLALKIRKIDEKAATIDETQAVNNACSLNVSTETFQSILASMGYEVDFDWRKSGDPLYMLTPEGNESYTDEK